MVILLIGFFFVISFFAFLIYTACVVAARADKILLRGYDHHQETGSPLNSDQVDFRETLNESPAHQSCA